MRASGILVFIAVGRFEYFGGDSSTKRKVFVGSLVASNSFHVWSQSLNGQGDSQRRMKVIGLWPNLAAPLVP
jgi:hypothetical protein